MILPDVNVLVAAFRSDHPMHEASRQWLSEQISRPAAFGVCERVLEGFIRVVAHPRIFASPDSIEDAVAFTRSLTSRKNCVRVTPAPYRVPPADFNPGQGPMPSRPRGRSSSGSPLR